jgi:hypothetical protein
MYAAAQIHEAGVVHGQLNEDHIVKAVDGIRIIDFSMAIRHRCVGAYPMLHDPALVYLGCRELCRLERKFGQMDAFHVDLGKSAPVAHGPPALTI